MGIVEGIVVFLKIAFLLLGKWSSWDDKQKEKVKELLKETKDAKDPASITRTFDAINRL